MTLPRVLASGRGGNDIIDIGTSPDSSGAFDVGLGGGSKVVPTLFTSEILDVVIVLDGALLFGLGGTPETFPASFDLSGDELLREKVAFIDVGGVVRVGTGGGGEKTFLSVAL